MHGVSLYDFSDETWAKLSYYPAKCLGKAAMDGTFEMPSVEEIEAESEQPSARVTTRIHVKY